MSSSFWIIYGITTAAIPAYPDKSKSFILYTDATDGCICASLTQVQNEGNNSTG